MGLRKPTFYADYISSKARRQWYPLWIHNWWLTHYKIEEYRKIYYEFEFGKLKSEGTWMILNYWTFWPLKLSSSSPFGDISLTRWPLDDTPNSYLPCQVLHDIQLKWVFKRWKNSGLWHVNLLLGLPSYIHSNLIISRVQRRSKMGLPNGHLANQFALFKHIPHCKINIMSFEN